MRLKENAIYLKLVSRHDAINDGLYRRAIAELETFAGASFETYQDLKGTRLPSRAIGSELHYDVFEGIGFHPTVRFALSGSSVIRSLEINGGLHPYSGVYVVNLDVRFDAALVAERVTDLIDLAERLATLWDPLTLHIHDVDDDSIQNIDNPRLLELGYGIKASTELADRPGREASRGQFRFTVNWVSYFGAETLELLKAADRDEWPVENRVIGSGRWFQLAASPSEIGTAEFRASQTALRAALDYDALIDKDRKSFSYWKRKP
ncbi:MAG: hypothetical protein ACJAYU_004244 [Bradymonadia bacterium]|jgi:hypothetical protein